MSSSSYRRPRPQSWACPWLLVLGGLVVSSSSLLPLSSAFTSTNSKEEMDILPFPSSSVSASSFLDLSHDAKAAYLSFPPPLSLWEDARVVPITSDSDTDDEDLQQDSSSTISIDQQQLKADKHDDGSSSSLPPSPPSDDPISSRSWRSRWRMESRYADLAVAESEYPFCAWDATTDESIYTPLLLDPNAVYQPQMLSFASHPDRVYKMLSFASHPDRLYKVTASFPKVIYFSYQSYNLRGLPLTSLSDLHIWPSTGKNPYREEAREDEVGSYDIHVTREGNKGWSNEVRGLSEDRTNSSRTAYTRVVDFLDNLSILMLRFYTPEQPPSIWGGVAPPVVTYSDDNGKSWTELKPCTDATRYLFNKAMKQLGWTGYELRDLFTHSQWYRLRSCPLLGLREADTPTLLPNPALQASGSAGYVPYANYDSSYLHWCTDGRQLGKDFIMIIEGTAPLTATGLFEGPRRVWNVSSYSVRYWGFAAADIFIPGPTYSSVTATEMENFYGEGWDRKYKVLGARSREVAKACGLDDPKALLLPFQRDELNNNPAAIPAVIEREMLARHTAMNQPPEVQSIDFVTTNCDKDKKCSDTGYMKDSLQEQYPSLKVYTCDVATGIATPYVYKPYRRDYEGTKGDSMW